MSPTQSEGRFVCYVDGGCWPNPGPGAKGACLAKEDGSIVCEQALMIQGDTTNMRAEYEALQLGIRISILCGAKEVHFVSDSQTMVKQVLGSWNVENEEIKRFHDAVSADIRRLDWWSISFVPRAENERADWLVNTVLRPEDKRALKEPSSEIVFREGRLMQGWATMGGKKAA